MSMTQVWLFVLLFQSGSFHIEVYASQTRCMDAVRMAKEAGVLGATCTSRNLNQ